MIRRPPYTPSHMPDVRERVVRALRGETHDNEQAERLARTDRADDARTLGEALAYRNLTGADLIRWARTAELYHVSAEMSREVDRRVQGRARTRNYDLDHETVPAPVGFVVFAEPIHVMMGTPVEEIDIDPSLPESELCPLRGFIWAPTQNVYGAGVTALPFCDPEAVVGMTWLRRFAARTGVTAESLAHGAGEVAFVDLVTMPFGRREHLVTNYHVAAALTVWEMIHERVAVTERQRVGRPQVSGKGGGRKPAPHVNVITLRRPIETHEALEVPPEHPGRVYTHSWEVTQHERTYWTGPGRSVPVKRTVASYKARTDLPEDDRERVYALRR